MAKKHKLKVGDYVRWNDPGINDYEPENRQAMLDREFIIEEINGEIILISDGYSEAEVTANELEPLVKVVVLEVDEQGLLAAVMVFVNDVEDDSYWQEVAIDGVAYDVKLTLIDPAMPWRADNIKAIRTEFDDDENEAVFTPVVKKVLNY